MTPEVFDWWVGEWLKVYYMPNVIMANNNAMVDLFSLWWGVRV